MTPKSIDIYLGMAVAALVFTLLVAPHAKAAGPVINFATNSATIPDGDGGWIELSPLPLETGLLGGTIPRSIRIYRWGEYVCGDLKFKFFELQPNQVRTVKQQSGEECEVIRPNGTFLRGSSQWEVRHQMGWDADHNDNDDIEDWCSMLHEFWCRIF